MKSRSKVKLGLGVLLGFFVILLIGYWWRYSRKIKVDSMISKSANWLVFMDLRKVEETLLWDAVFNPLSYWNGSSKSKDDSGAPANGLIMPSHLLVYGVAHHPDIVFSESLKIEKKTFSAYVDTLVFRQEFEKISDHFIYNNTQQLFYFWEADKLGIAFAKKRDLDFVQETISNLLAGKNVVPISQDLSERLTQNKHHFAIWQKPTLLVDGTNNQPAILYGDFNKGNLTIEGEVQSNHVFGRANQLADSQENDILSLSANLNITNQSFQFSSSFGASFRKITNLEIDSVLKYWTGGIDIQVPQIDHRVDTIITYEYDDDFNKMEKISTQKIIDPQLIIHLGEQQDGALFQYFERRHLIKNINGEQRFVGLPLVEMKAFQQKNNLTLISKNMNPKQGQQLTPNFLNLRLNVNRYPELLNYLPFGIDKKYSNLLQEVQVVGHDIPGFSKVYLEAKIQLKNKNRNVLGVLATTP